MRSRRSGLRQPSVRMLCRRSASFTMMTRMSFDHGQQHLAEALGLPVFGGEEVELAELGDAVDAARHFLAEILADIARP